MRAVICGGGIGGLAAALCLRRAGWTVTVLEQAPQLGEVGAGLQISANGFRVLDALGLGPAVKALAYEPDVIELRMGISGRRVMSIPMRQVSARRWGAPYLQILRPDLLSVLHDAVTAEAPGTVRTGARVSGYRVSGQTAYARFGDDEIEADLLIGADGVRSTIRDAMLGPQPPRFTGNVAWRAVVPRDRLPGLDIPPGACIWAGEGRHAVTYPLRGGALNNFVGVVEQGDWQTESWTQQGLRQDAVADFAGWHPVVTTLLETADAHFKWALFDRPPLPRWSDGPVTLLGDACHPMLPSLAQGACQALEDAWALAALLPADRTGPADIPAALSTYEHRRKPRVSRIQKGAADNVRLFHKRGTLAKTAAYGLIAVASRLAPGFIHGRNDWIYRHDVTAKADGATNRAESGRAGGQDTLSS